MKLKIICSVFYFNLVFSFADFIVQFTNPVKVALSKIAQVDALDCNIHRIESKRLILKLFENDCFENAYIYAKILLENENEVLSDVREKLIIMNLLHRTNVIFLLWYKKFGMTYEQARVLENSFRETMKLIDPKYH